VRLTALHALRACKTDDKDCFLLDTISPAGLGHMFNIVLAVILAQSATDRDVNECAWYFFNFSFDTVAGVPLSYLLLRTAERTVLHSCPRSGHYYNPETQRISPKRWAWQTVSWCAIVLLTKMLLAVPVLLLARQLGALGTWIFRPIDHSPKFELVVVMVLTPAIFNSVQFYVIDSFLKRRLTVLDGFSTGDGQSALEGSRLLVSDADSEGSDSTHAAAPSNGNAISTI
ncbi:Vacuolar membrane protein YPL162C, partial [Durusdinium trenchii]